MRRSSSSESRFLPSAGIIQARPRLDSPTTGPAVRSIARLIQLPAAFRHRIEKRRNLAVEKLHIGRVEAAGGSMTRHRARRDRHHPDILDALAGFDRLEFTIAT